MSSKDQPTLAAALQVDGKSMREQLGRLTKECVELDAKGRIGAFLAPRFWHHVGGEMELLLLDKLNALGAFDVLSQGWVIARKLLEYADPVRHPPGERNVVGMAQWKWKHSLRLQIDLLVNGIPFPTVELDLVFEFVLDTLSLAVVNGCIESVSLDKAEVSAKVRHGDQTLKEFSLRRFDLPGEYRFEHPLPIVSAERYAAEAAGR